MASASFRRFQTSLDAGFRFPMLLLYARRGMSVQAVLFDFGHTLMDFGRTEDALRGAYTTIRERLVHYVEDQAPPEVDELVERVAATIDKMLEHSYEQQAVEELDIFELFQTAYTNIGYHLPEALLRELIELDHDVLRQSVRIEESSLQTLETLRSMGYKLGVVSNVTQLPELLHRDLEDFGIKPRVDAVALSCEIGIRKPRPQIFTHVLDALDVKPTEAVFVGDRLVDDVAGAHALGMKAILTHQYRQEQPDENLKPDAIVSNVSEVPSVIADW
jgi:putative hydrolase of the HAD superfamily